jgi:hypothetical protein
MKQSTEITMLKKIENKLIIYLIIPLTLQRGDLNSAAVSLLRYFFQPGI